MEELLICRDRNLSFVLTYVSQSLAERNLHKGSVYNESSLYDNGMIGEKEWEQLNNTIAVKYHGIRRLSTELKAAGVILLVSLLSQSYKVTRKL